MMPGCNVVQLLCVVPGVGVWSIPRSMKPPPFVLLVTDCLTEVSLSQSGPSQPKT